MKTTIKQRLEKARARAEPLIKKMNTLNLEEMLSFIRNNRVEYKKIMNIINRYYNLNARENGFGGGIKQAIKELK